MNKRQKIKRKLKVRDSELYNLDHTICEWILPRLKRFKQINIAYPGFYPIDTIERWNEALDKMILAFELSKEDLPSELSFDELKKVAVERDKQIKEGLHLFAEYFSALWF